MLHGLFLMCQQSISGSNSLVLTLSTSNNNVVQHLKCNFLLILVTLYVGFLFLNGLCIDFSGCNTGLTLFEFEMS